jgi:hypothetical protein
VAELGFFAADNAHELRPQASIRLSATAVTAFIGRALKGPVNQPITIASFNDYQRVFGGLWQPSPLSYALEQYFQNGGREAIVVRVCNGGHPPTLRLPAGAAHLTLVGLWPGRREFLRASVDYDGIAAEDTDRFNLVIQRIRAPGSEFIEEQEIFRRVSIVSGADRGVAGMLTVSRLVRARGTLPRQRPELTRGAVAGAVGYVMSNGDGDDGDALSNYDIIGDAKSGSGLFALQGAESFNFLCVPPLSREADIGLPALLVALRLCRQRRAMLLVDPPAAWSDAAAAIDGLRHWPLYSEDALMFYPRVLALDRLRGRHDLFGSAAAAAGLLARLDRAGPVWSVDDQEEPPLRPPLSTATSATDLDQIRLAQAGVNLLQPAHVAPRAAQPSRIRLRTLVAEGAARSDWRELAIRRLTLLILSSVERGTRWVVYERPGPGLFARVHSQLTAFFQALEHEGAFAASGAEENYYVICDERLNDAGQAAAGRFQLLFGFAASRAGDFQSWLVTHEPGATSARAASVNRYALPPRS